MWHEERFPPARVSARYGSERRRSSECTTTGETHRERLVGAGDEAAESDPPQAAASRTRPRLDGCELAAQGAPSRQNLIVMIEPKMMIRGWSDRLLAACAVCVAVAVVTRSHSVPATDFPAADDLMLRLMSMDNVSGVALMLIKDGRIVLEKGYGFRDLESHAPVTTATLFNIGSISKSFTALGIAQLVDQHQVELDAPVIKYIPDLRLSDPRAAQAVTLRQLLSHTSGLPPDDQWPQQVPATREGIVSEFANMPITAQPGTRFQYCSRCIVLAAYVLERITGQSWEAYTRAHIFEPLGMTAASFGPLGLEQAADRAQPYRHDAVLGEVPVPWGRLQYLEPLGPAGGIDANIDEMARYALLQLDDGTISGHQVLSAQMMAELHRPEIAVGPDWTPAARTEDMHYALGWFTASVRGVNLVFHNGANPGFRAAIFLMPSTKAGVVILTNGESERFTDAATRGLLEQLLQ
jgi:CubicO group peptidase (beta-lactamase class C family)